MNDERLAAYLSGDLDPDEHADITARLAGDPALRARVDRIAAADRMLADLPDVPLPEGFSERLRAGIQPDLDAVLGDELAVRRSRRAARARWVMAGAAAAVVTVVGVGAVITGLGRPGNELATTTEDTAGAVSGSMLAPEGTGALPPPQVVALGRTLTDEDLQELASRQQFTMVSRSALSTGDASEYAERTQEQLDTYAESDAAPPAAVQEGADAPGGEDGTAADLSAVSACLPVIVESSDAPLVPLYVELATYDGEDVVVFVLLAQRGDSGDMSRVEVWVLTVDGCETRYFTQHDS